MHTLAFVTQKGGAGKSTLAACLAVAAHEAGEKVFLIDMDPQRSLLNWGQSRTTDSIGIEAVPAAKLQGALAALAANGFTLAVIDTAGSDSPAATAAMKAADLCLIPSRPSAFDVRATEVTRDSLKTLKVPYAFVLNQCPPGPHNSRAKDGARALELMGGLVSPFISTRVDYQTAALTGQGVTELNPEGKAAEEMRALWVSIKNRMKGIRHGQAVA